MVTDGPIQTLLIGLLLLTGKRMHLLTIQLNGEMSMVMDMGIINLEIIPIFVQTLNLFTEIASTPVAVQIMRRIQTPTELLIV